VRIELQPQGRASWPRLDIPLRIEPLDAGGPLRIHVLRRTPP